MRKIFLIAIITGSIIFNTAQAQNGNLLEAKINATNLSKQLVLDAATSTQFKNIYVDGVREMNKVKLNIALTETQKAEQQKLIMANTDAKIKDILPGAKYTQYTNLAKPVAITPTVISEKPLANTTATLPNSNTVTTNTTTTPTSNNTSNIWTTTNLSTTHQNNINIVKTKLQLDATQTQKFSTDYINFINKTVENDKKFANNTTQKDAANKMVLEQTLNSIKTYFNGMQQLGFAGLLQNGELKIVPDAPNSNTVTANTNIAPTANTNANNLPAEAQLVINNVIKQCNLDANQSAKFTTDFTNFLKKTVEITTKYNGNTAAAKPEQDVLVLQTLGSLKSYFNQQQQEKFIQMVQTGQLDAKNISNTNTTNLPTSTTATNANINANVKTTLDKLQPTLKLNTTQYNQLLQLANTYETQKVGANATQLNQLNTELATKLRSILSNEQFNIFAKELMAK